MANLAQDFAGKVAIVTGGASGIGEAVAQAIAARGGQVIIADIDQDDAERSAAAITETGGVAKFIKTDVSDAEAIEAMVQFAVESYGGLDVAINNAGIGGPLGPTGNTRWTAGGG
jgi:NAD(P)-dependent dehydrogenase (short-subunit alcohol dehydrogenase family)